VIRVGVGTQYPHGHVLVGRTLNRTTPKNPTDIEIPCPTQK
jgi:hypothetical protein